MKNPSPVRTVTLIALMVAGIACSSGSSEADTVSSCTPGQSIQCAGVSGCVGAQVCKADGSGYDACQCGNGSNTGTSLGAGGSGSNAAMHTGGTWQASTSGLGGMANSSAGGNQSGVGSSPAATGGAITTLGGSGNTTSIGKCAPVDMTGYSYPAYKPARHVAGACTDQAIQQYYTECYTAGNCSAFVGAGANATCGSCLEPVPLSADSYGPLLIVGNASSFFYETNVAGCEELVGATTCAPKMQIEFLCEYGACSNSCPLSDSASYDAFFQCMSSAQTTVCSKETTAARCLTTSAQVSACSGSNFQAQFVAIAKVFCQ